MALNTLRQNITFWPKIQSLIISVYFMFQSLLDKKNWFCLSVLKNLWDPRLVARLLLIIYHFVKKIATLWNGIGSWLGAND